MTQVNEKQTVVDFGVSGYVNTEVELKVSDSGTKYVSVLLGRGQDQRGNNLPSDSVVLYNKDAELFAMQVKKGDLIRFTKVALQRIVPEGKTYATAVKLVGKDFVHIGKKQDGAQQGSQAPRQQAPQPQPAPSPDSFDDDIPF